MVSSSPSATSSPSESGIYESKLYSYTLTLPSGWLAGQQALLPWDGVAPVGHADLDVDQFVGPNGTTMDDHLRQFSRIAQVLGTT